MKKIKIITWLAWFCMLALLSGCKLLNPGVKPPKTDLSLRAGSWKLDLDAEKDTAIGGLIVGVTNGPTHVSVTMTNFVSTNSPTVITRTGVAQQLTLDAQGRVVDASGNVIGKLGEILIDRAVPGSGLLKGGEVEPESKPLPESIPSDGIKAKLEELERLKAEKDAAEPQPEE